MFSNGSFSSTSRATVTPSCVTVGAPNFLSSATLRPLGPSVVLTAFAMVSTPDLRDLRASSVNTICFGIRSSLLFLDDGREDVLLRQDQELLVVQLELGAGVLLEEDAVAHFQLHRDPLTVLVPLTRTDRQHPALLRLFLRRVRQDDAALRDVFALHSLDHHATAKRFELELRLRGFLRRYCHAVLPLLVCSRPR